MTFIDIIAFQLFSLAFVAALLFYSGVSDYLAYRKYGFKEAYRLLRSQATLLGIVGIIVIFIGLWGETTWPISTIVNGTNVLGPYNILFYDPYLMLGMVLVGFSACVLLGLNTKYSGLLAIMTGALSIYYGVNAYGLGLTKEPIVMLMLYIAFGITAIFTFPVTIFIDGIIIEPMQGVRPARSAKKLVKLPWKLAFIGFVIFLLFSATSAMIALAIGGGALAPHLASSP